MQGFVGRYFLTFSKKASTIGCSESLQVIEKCEKSGRALTRDEILNVAWVYDSFSGPRSIDRFVTTLRNKTETDPHNPTFIHTIRENAYKFDPLEKRK